MRCRVQLERYDHVFDALGDETGEFERAGRERHIEASGSDAMRASDGAVRRAACGGRGE
jgi:hypothetical protein